MFKNFINGHWEGGDNAAPSVNPSDLNDVVGEYALADETQAGAAIEAAAQAFPGWALGSVQRRAEILDFIGSEILARKDELGTLRPTPHRSEDH